MAKSSKPATGLTVAITGPTGDIGRGLISRLQSVAEVETIRGMARRPFDPARYGWTKFEYRQGDILDRTALDDLVADADVVVHLAFVIVGGPEETRSVNLDGSRNVFRATIQAGVPRLVYASSVAAYGFHPDNPQPLTEDVPPRGTDGFYYSAQKAELEGVLGQLLIGARTEAYVVRPSIVAGGDALAMIENIPFVQVADRLPDSVRRLIGALPAVRPVIPDPGVPFQLVHQDDVAEALMACTLGQGSPGFYNLAADGQLSVAKLAEALGWYSVPVPPQALQATAEVVDRLPFTPPQAEWITAFRVPVIMDTTRARQQLKWSPRYDSMETLRDTVRSAREAGLLG